MMDVCAKVYITSDYSVELNKEDMKIILPRFSFVKNFFQKIFWRICRQNLILLLLDYLALALAFGVGVVHLS